MPKRVAILGRCFPGWPRNQTIVKLSGCEVCHQVSCMSSLLPSVTGQWHWHEEVCNCVSISFSPCSLSYFRKPCVTSNRQAASSKLSINLDLCKSMMLFWKPIITTKEYKIILTFPTINGLYCRQLTVFEVIFAYKTMHYCDKIT